MSVQWADSIPPYTEDDVTFLKHCKVDPWRHDGRGFKRDYKPDVRPRPTLPGRLAGIGIIAALMFTPVFIWWMRTR